MQPSAQIARPDAQIARPDAPATMPTGLRWTGYPTGTIRNVTVAGRAEASEAQYELEKMASKCSKSKKN